jgi:hypothetical protein
MLERYFALPRSVDCIYMPVMGTDGSSFAATPCRTGGHPSLLLLDDTAC